MSTVLVREEIAEAGIQLLRDRGFDVFDIATMLAAVEIALADLGAEIERGVAVSAALEAFEHTAVA